MKVGVTYTLRNAAQPKWFTPWPDYYAQALDHIADVDRLGFHSVNFCEHHFDPDGYNPSVLVIMTAVALRTQRVMIGQNILQLPYHHPVRLAEDLATVDILSSGRVTLNAGQAGAPFDDEFHALGLNPRQRPSRTEEGIDIVRRCWTEEAFSHQGKRWQLQDVRVYPKPLQQPHPPIYTTTSGEASMDRAARMGLNACGQGGTGAAPTDKAQWQGWLRRWQAALAKYGRRPEDFKVNTFGQLYVTEDPERAWAKHREAVFYRRAYRRFDGSQPYLFAFQGGPAEKPEDLPNWDSMFLTPEECVKRLRETFAESAPDEMIISADGPGMLFEDTAEYLRLFAEKVMPQLQDLPVH